MFNTFKELADFIQREKVAFIDLKFCDLFGQWHHITLPVSNCDERLLNEGVGFDASSTPGFKSLEAGDMVLIPDLATAFIDPFWDDRTLSLICNIHEADTRQRFHRDPRYIAARAEEFLRQTGIADVSYWGPEFEYYIFDRVEFHNQAHHSHYHIDSIEAPWSDQTKSGPNGYHMAPHTGYHAIPPFDTLYNIRSETTKILEQCGIPVNYHHHEVGPSGQVEIEVILGPLTRMGDVVMITKYVAKMVARKYGKTATFMPKPLYQEAGNGMHFHQHLFKNGQPLFYDKNGYGSLSPLALSYIAGILQHAPALTGLTNPSTNSYKRLIPGFEAPVSLFFSLANRSSSVRIPKYATTPDKKRIEFRTPDATCNPYLAMAAMLLAGIDGIRENLDITAAGFGPYDANLFAKENESIRRRIRAVPESLADALRELAQDHSFLTRDGIFRPDLIETWIDIKRQKEIIEVRNRPTPYEYQLYFGV